MKESAIKHVKVHVDAILLISLFVDLLAYQKLVAQQFRIIPHIALDTSW